MEHIGVIGLSWRQGGADALARFALPTAEDALLRLRAAMGAIELVYLGTCNRVEVYFTVDDPAKMASMRSQAFEALTGTTGDPGEPERCMRAWAGEGAAEHLFLVAAGLDSAEVGETEIGGQLRRAIDTAREVGTLQKGAGRLEYLLEETLRLSKRIRANSGLCTGKTSLAEIALDKMRRRLATTGGAATLVGVSPMTERCAIALATAGTPLVLVNRTRERATALKLQLQKLPGAGPIEVLSLDHFRQQPPATEVLLSATGAPGAVLEAAALARVADAPLSGEALMIIDMAVPPDVPPEQARALGVDRIGMDAIIEIAESSRDQRLKEMAGAREEIDAALGRLRIRMGDEHVAPFVTALQKRYRKVAKQGAKRLLSTSLVGLNDDQQAAVLRFAESLAGRFAHLPSTGLRGVARVAGAPAVDAFLSHADAEMAKEFELARREAKARDDYAIAQTDQQFTQPIRPDEKPEFGRAQRFEERSARPGSDPEAKATS
ncbi:MAG: glutamyl-tRNA reductase [Planctomycetota bacterium]|jgi:glutamyl-tRNA reductase